MVVTVMVVTNIKIFLQYSIFLFIYRLQTKTNNSYMKTIATLLFFTISISVSAQNIEVTGGALHNNFFDTEGTYAYRSFSEKSHIGYAFSIGIDNINIDWLPLRFTLGYENYGGSIEASEDGHMYSKSIDFDIKKSVLSLGIYFINFNFFGHLDLNAGVQLNRVLSESVDGSGELWVYSDILEPTITEIGYKGKKSNYGLRGRIAYDFDINDRFAISPQYDFYYGLSYESSDFPSSVKSYKQYLSLGLQMKVGK